MGVSREGSARRRWQVNLHRFTRLTAEYQYVTCIGIIPRCEKIRCASDVIAGRILSLQRTNLQAFSSLIVHGFDVAA